MHIIEALYTLGVVVSIAASLPQIRQLVVTKASDEFNLSTWLAWAMTQAMTLVYVVSLQNPLMVIANIAWVSFYTTMSILIIRYRRPSKTPFRDVLTDEI